MLRFLLLLFSCSAFSVAAQPLSDSIVYNDHDDVVVTATRTGRQMGNVAVPVLVIGQQTIRQSGALRLNEVLQEQTGIFLTGGTGSNAVGGGVFGNGIQLQGLSPDYILILLDGEPMIGRQGGIMDLSRFSTGNIRKIEIVKGPSSSLYGSEAMGGVVNIITENTRKNQLKADFRYGSFQSTDMAVSGTASHNKTGLYYFLNRNSGQGYDLDKNTPEATLDPWHNYTGQLKLTQQLAERTTLSLNSRYFYSQQESYYALNSPSINVGGRGTTGELNLNPVLTHRFSSHVKSTLRLTANTYRYRQLLDSISNKQSYYRDDFKQGFFRTENQTDIEISPVQTLSAGLGYTVQTVSTSRYREDKQQQVAHAFVQHQWQPLQRLTLISGLRYDHNTDFASRLSPKLAAQFRAGEKIRINASYGAGFKAPDFRQLYLNFVNNAADGYSIYGAAEFSLTEMERQRSAGLIAEILPAAYGIRQLKPEVSNGLNLGVQWQPIKVLQADVNIFRNDISNLILFTPVALHNNGAQVFSYRNVNRAYTQGAELSICAKPVSWLTVAGGYQYLETADKQVLQDIKAGKVYGRSYEGGPARLLTRKDYTGLLNRSTHMANLRIAYDNTKNGWGAALRLIYRSRWGVQDRDANGFANFSGEFAPSMLQTNISVSKTVGRFTIQSGVNNLFNSTNARYAPNIPGTNWFTTLHFQFKK